MLQKPALQVAQLDRSRCDLTAFEFRKGNLHPWKFESARGRYVCGVFLSPICYFAWAYLDVYRKLLEMPDVVLVGIHSTPYEKPSDTEWRIHKEKLQMILLDDTKDQALKEWIGATISPTAFILDKDGTFRYFGAIDYASRKRPLVLPALDALRAGKSIARNRTTPFGCWISPVPASTPLKK